MSMIRKGLGLALAGTVVGLGGCGGPPPAAPAADPHAAMLAADDPAAFAERELLALPPVKPNPVAGQLAFDQPLSSLFPNVTTNGRSCASCHVPGAGLTLSPASVRGLPPTDPLLTAAMADAGPDVTQAEILAKLKDDALVRVNLKNPWYDPKLGNAPDNPGDLRFWRAVPTAINSGRAMSLSYTKPGTKTTVKGTIMWDLREPTLEQQAVDASRGHAQATSYFSRNLAVDIAEHERKDFAIPPTLYAKAPVPPRRDPRRTNPADPFFGAPVFDLATANKQFLPSVPLTPGTPAWRGFQLFLGTPGKPACITCHNMPDTLAGGTIANRSAGVSELNEPGFPLVKLRLKDAKGAWHTVTTADPGVAVTTGRYEDLNTFKVAQLRGLSKFGRFFHDNHARDLKQAVRHYKDALPAMFGDLKGHEINDLAAFLAIL
jgi:cytochrome c peroxidase